MTLRIPALLATLAGLGATHRSPPPAPPRSEPAEVVVFDGGERCCTVVLTAAPDPKVLVVDGGSAELARGAVLPFLEARGATAIDLMVLTSHESSSLEGLSVLLQELAVLEVWDPGCREPSREHRAFAQQAQARAGDRYYARLEDRVTPGRSRTDSGLGLGESLPLGSAELVLLHTDDLAETETSSAEEGVLVVKVLFGEASILLGAGAAPAGAERGARRTRGRSPAPAPEAPLLELEERARGILHSTLLLLPPGRELGERLLEAIAPEWAAVGSPSPTVDRLVAARVNLLRLDAHDGRGDDHLRLLVGPGTGELSVARLDTARLLDASSGTRRPSELLRPGAPGR